MSLFSFESLETTNLPKIEFDIVYEKDLICNYNLVDHDVQEGDRIAIFKLGWQHLKDYVLFEWVTGKTGAVTFKEDNLPKDLNEIYQLCYITGDNAVLGVSKPIELCKKVFSMYQSNSTFRDSIISSCNTADFGTSPSPEFDKDNLITKLRDENTLLKDVLKVVVLSNKLGNFEKEIDYVKSLTKYLKETVINQQKEITKLRKTLSDHIGVCQNLEHKEETIKKYSAGVKGDFDLGDLKSIPPLPLSY